MIKELVRKAISTMLKTSKKMAENNAEKGEGDLYKNKEETDVLVKHTVKNRTLNKMVREIKKQM